MAKKSDSKLCRKCSTVKPISDFHISTRDGTNNWCKSCSNAGCRARYVKNRDKYVDYRLRKGYGISLAEYSALLASQKALCAICGKPETGSRYGRPCSLVIDHDHVSGERRELLCTKCNSALGMFGEDISVLTKAIAYIEKHRKKNEDSR